MKKIFCDANVLVDYLDASSADHRIAFETFKIIFHYFEKPVVSPISFIICNYLFSKKIKNKDWHRAKMKKFFSAFVISPVLPEMIDRIFQSHFSDLEDALQYECALSHKIDLIVTKNVSDFFASTIPVVHPQDFIKRYYKLFNF